MNKKEKNKLCEAITNKFMQMIEKCNNNKSLYYKNYKFKSREEVLLDIKQIIENLDDTPVVPFVFYCRDDFFETHNLLGGNSRLVIIVEINKTSWSHNYIPYCLLEDSNKVLEK